VSGSTYTFAVSPTVTGFTIGKGVNSGNQGYFPNGTTSTASPYTVLITRNGLRTTDNSNLEIGSVSPASIAFKSTSSSALLKTYEEHTVTTTMQNASNGAITGDLSIFCTRVGRTATLVMNAFPTAATTFNTAHVKTATALESIYRPLTAILHTIIIHNGTTRAVGVAEIGTDGIIKLYADASLGAWPNTSNQSWDRFSVSYAIV
jgi:hypothetical protein